MSTADNLINLVRQNKALKAKMNTERALNGLSEVWHSLYQQRVLLSNDIAFADFQQYKDKQ